MTVEGSFFSFFSAFLSSTLVFLSFGSLNLCRISDVMVRMVSFDSSGN